MDKSDKAFPDNPDTRYLRSLCLLSAGKNVESLENLNPLLENWRTYRLDSSLGFSLDTALVTSGDAIYRLEAPDDALEIFERALQVNNNNAAACFGAALCLRDLGAPDDALTMLNHAVRLNSEYESLAAEFEKEN